MTIFTVKDSRISFIVNRGYTGHEHLDAFGIINMNGRVYDPLTAMFFSPDPYVQAPGNWLTVMDIVTGIRLGIKTRAGNLYRFLLGQLSAG